MASEYYGLNRGQTEFSIVNGTSTNSTDIEVRVDLTKSWKKAEVLQKLEEIKNHILKDKAAVFG